MLLPIVGQVAATGGTFDGQSPNFSGGENVALFVDDARAIPWHRHAGRTGARLRLGVRNEDVQQLRGPDAVN